MGRSDEASSGAIGLMRLEVRPAAAADIEEAALWYESQRPGLGSEFLEELRHVEAAIAKSPNAIP